MNKATSRTDNENRMPIEDADAVLDALMAEEAVGEVLRALRDKVLDE